MKVVVLFSLVALCFSIGISKHITVNEDSAVSIVSPEGRKIQISRSEDDPTKIDIVLTNPSDLQSLKIQVNEAVNFRTAKSKYIHDGSGLLNQADVLASIFGKHEGTVDQATYQNLLLEIGTLVEYGILHNVVLRSLLYLDQPTIADELRKELLGVSYLPAEGVTRIQISDVRILDTYQNDPLHQGQHGLQGLRNQNLSPYHHLQTIQIIRQGSESDRSITPPSLLFRSQYQSPLARFLYNLRGQRGTFFPYQHIQQVPQTQVQNLNQQYPQPFNRRQQFHPQGYQQLHPQGYQQFHPQGYQQSHPQGYQQFHPQGYQQEELQGYQQEEPQGYQQEAPQGYQQEGPQGYQQEEPQSYRNWRLSAEQWIPPKENQQQFHQNQVALRWLRQYQTAPQQWNLWE